MRRADRALLLIGLFALLGTAVDHLPAFGITPMRRPISAGATPTPRPTTIVLSASNSTVCGVDDRYFGSGAVCNATNTAVDVAMPEDGTLTSMSCTQPTDGSCTIGFQLQYNPSFLFVDATGFYCESVNNSTCVPGSPSATAVLSTYFLVVKVTDVSETCASNAPTCVVSYTVP